MTRPIHSVKHIQTSYRKYQLIAISSAILTIVAVILASLSSFQLGNLGKQRVAASRQNRIASASMDAELAKLKNRITTLETRLSEESSQKEGLDKKNKTLKRKLTEAQQALAAKEAEPQQPPPVLPIEIEQPSSPGQLETPPVGAPNQSEAVKTSDIEPITDTPASPNVTSSQPRAQEDNTQPLQNNVAPEIQDNEKPLPAPVETPPVE